MSMVHLYASYSVAYNWGGQRHQCRHRNLANVPLHSLGFIAHSPFSQCVSLGWEGPVKTDIRIMYIMVFVKNYLRIK